MKSFIISTAAALFLTLTYAAPAQNIAPRQFLAFITFEGATPEAYFTQSVPTDGSVFYISNPLSISHINSQGGATCVFNGIDGSVTEVVGAETVDVGPPQTQISGSCEAF